MSELRRTELRHRMLAMTVHGAYESYCATFRNGVRKLRMVGGVLGGPEARGLGELRDAGLIREVPQNRVYAPRPVVRTRKGDELLAEWNAQFGEVSA